MYHQGVDKIASYTLQHTCIIHIASRVRKFLSHSVLPLPKKIVGPFIITSLVEVYNL